MNGIESNVEETLSDSRGSFRKTKVMPFCLEKTRMTKPDNLISDKVILKRDCEGGRSGERLGRGEGWSGGEICVEGVCLDACFERQKGVARVGHLEDSAKEAVLGKVANLEDFQVGRRFCPGSAP